MKLHLNILKNSKALNIDNENISWPKVIDKIDEESNEVKNAILDYYCGEGKRLLLLKEIIRECFDLIQVCILVLFKCNTHANTLDEANLIQDVNKEHLNKLSIRGWTSLANIEIEVKEVTK